jgi:hypothetical protein
MIDDLHVDDIHVSDEEIAAFVEGGLDAQTRLRVEAHLLACDDCRSILAATGRLLAPPVRRTRRRLVLLAGGLAAAAALLLMVVPSTHRLRITDRTRDTDVGAPGRLAVLAQSPIEDASVRVDTLSFHWSPTAPEAAYQVTVSTEAGAIVWTERSTDTVLALPAAVATRLQPGRVYYWQVDALLPDLRSATSGPRRFTVVPR